MGRLVADLFVTLDGVVQAPGSPHEDTDGGFRHGGWHHEHADETVQAEVVRNTQDADAFLFGRRTYELFADFWPHAPTEFAPLADALNSRPKYVVSSSLNEPLGWSGSELLRGDPVDAVARLRADVEGEVHLVGSARLTRTLLAHDLMDELRLVIDPVFVGGGKRVFPDDGELRTWRITSSVVAPSGAIIAHYAPRNRGAGA
jgi:dihydrofolate reductase